MQYMWQQQNGMGEFQPSVTAGYDVFNPSVADGFRNWLPPSELMFLNIHPQLLPPGQLVFSFPASHLTQYMDRQAHLATGSKIKNEEPEKSWLLFAIPPVRKI
jgi:hypothetical protein